MAGLDYGYLTKAADRAAEVRAADDSARLRPGQATVTQAQLDRADGVNVLLLGHVLRAFRLGNSIDSSIPRIQPIATKFLFMRKTAKADAPSTKEPTESEAVEPEPVKAEAPQSRAGASKAEAVVRPAAPASAASMSTPSPAPMAAGKKAKKVKGRRGRRSNTSV